MGDIYTVVEFIMLLPGKRAGLIRSEASRLFLQFHGGDLSLADQVIASKWGLVASRGSAVAR